MMRRLSVLAALMLAACLLVTACGGDMLASTEQAKENAAQESSAVSVVPAQVAQESSAVSAEPIEVAQNQVVVVFDTSNAAAYNDKFPETLGSFVVDFEPGDSVFDALEKTGIDFESRGRSYVSSIGGVGEKACGPTSGWLYLVDGVQPTKNASDYELHGGESVLWAYTVTEGDVAGSTAMDSYVDNPADSSNSDNLI